MAGRQLARVAPYLNKLLLCVQDPTGEAASVAQKHLTFYEMDLGLNNVVRKWTEPIDNGANLLVAVPGGADGPGGVLVCAENFIIYKNQVWPTGAAGAAAGLPRPAGQLSARHAAAAPTRLGVADSADS
jgi:hypothetical protein